MKKIFITFVLAILLVATISAFDFDNTKDYDDETKMISINNCNLWAITCLIEGKKLADITLTSDLVMYVIPGEDRKVAEFELNNYDKEYIDALKKIDFYNLRNSEKINRVFTYKYQKVIGTKDIPITEQVCSIDKNKINVCSEVPTGTYETEFIYDWVEFSELSELPDGKVVIGIFTDVLPGDNVEWIPTFFGIQINEWAIWTDALNINLKLYWGFNEGTGIIVYDNSTNKNNGTLTNGAGWETGLVSNYAANFTTAAEGGNDYVISNGGVGITGADNRTINYWATMRRNYESTMINLGVTGGSNTEFRASVRNPGTGREWALSIDNSAYQTGDVVNTSKHMHTITYNSTTAIYYLDGIEIGNFEVVAATGGGNVYVGNTNLAVNEFGGVIDEVGIWSRPLTTSEIIDLYNGGSGIEFVPTAIDNSINSTVSLVSPNNGNSTVLGDLFFNTTITPTNANITNATFFIWYTNSTILNKTIVGASGMEANSSFFTLPSPPQGIFNWNLLGCVKNSTTSLCNYAASNYTFTRSSFSTDAIYFNPSVYETENQFYQSNITALAGISVVSSTLVYNGTNYPAEVGIISSSKYSLFSTIDVPLINTATSEDKPFHFEFTYISGSSKYSGNATSGTQQVNKTIFSKCGTTSTQPSANWSIFDEGNKTLAVSSDIKTSISYWLGSGNVKKLNNSITIAPSDVYCVNANRTFYASPTIELSASSYNSRIYQFYRESYNDTMRTTNLYLLNDSAGTNIIIEVKNSGLVALREYLVEIYRLYPDEGNYTLVESQITDDFGVVVSRLIENTVKYKFKFYDTNKKLVKSTGDLSVVCYSSYCTLPFVVEEVTDVFDDWRNNLSDYSYSLTFNPATNITTFAWDDNTGNSAVNRLEVIKWAMNQSILICNTSSSSADSILTCSLGPGIATYKIQAFRHSGGVERRIDFLDVKIGVTFDIYGKEGLIWVFILLFTMMAVGAFNPQIGALLFGAGFTVMGMLGIISFSFTVWVAVMIVCGVFIWAFRT